MQRRATLPDKENGMELSIPDEIVHAAGLSEQELVQELALLLFQQDRLTLGYASRLAGMYQGDFMDLLARCGISMHYDVEDFVDDLQTLRELERQR
jgi:predicted HTH domain antitoxin